MGFPRKCDVDTILVSLVLYIILFIYSFVVISICSFFFFGGLGIPVSQALLAHLFSYNITWSATVKEVERSNFFKEIPKIAKR